MFEFSNKINKLVSYHKLLSISYKDLTEDVRKMFKSLIGKKKMLKIPLTSDGRENTNYRKSNQHNLKRYFTYQFYILLFNFLYSATGAKLRDTGPNITKEQMKQLIKAVKKQKRKVINSNKINLKKIIEKFNMGAYSTVSEELNRLTKEHNDFDEKIAVYGRALYIIADNIVVLRSYELN